MHATTRENLASRLHAPMYWAAYKLPEAIITKARSAGLGQQLTVVECAVAEHLDRIRPDPDELPENLRGKNIRLGQAIKINVDLSEGTVRFQSTSGLQGYLPRAQKFDDVLAGAEIFRLPGGHVIDHVTITGDESSLPALRIARLLSGLTRAMAATRPEYTVEAFDLPRWRPDAYFLPHYSNSVSCVFPGAVRIEVKLDPHWTPLGDVVNRPPYQLRENPFEKGATLTFMPEEAVRQRMEGWETLRAAVNLFERALQTSPLRLRCGEDGIVSMTVPGDEVVGESWWKQLAVTEAGLFSGKHFCGCGG